MLFKVLLPHLLSHTFTYIYNTGMNKLDLEYLVYKQSTERKKKPPKPHVSKESLCNVEAWLFNTRRFNTYFLFFDTPTQNSSLRKNR